jgi:putative ABC transport system substrate-binding protein
MDRIFANFFVVSLKSAFRNSKSAILLGALLLALCSSVQAQQPEKVHRIGYLDISNSSFSAGFLEAFLEEMSKLGWVQGKNISMDLRFAEQKPARLPDLAADLVRLKMDVILCSGTPTVLAAKKATNNIPIVMATGGNPVAAGLVESLARPGGNITGLASLEEQLITKRLEILQDTVPRLTHVAVLWFGGGPGIQQKLALKQLTAAASALKLQLVEIETKIDPKGLESAFQTAVQKKADAMIAASARTLLTESKRIVELAGKYRLPAIYPQEELVDAGGLMSYGTDRADAYRRAAFYVDRILKGTKPADLPVEQPKKFEFIINLKAAKQIGLTIPPNVLARADKVIR